MFHRCWKPIDASLRRRIELTFFGLIFVSACIYSLVKVGNLHDWDPLLISGLGLLFLGIRLATKVPGSLKDALTRLTKRGVLLIQEDELSRLISLRFKDKAEEWAYVSGIIVSVAMLIVWCVVLSKRADWNDPGAVSLAAVEVIGGYVAGRYLGSMGLYGRLGQLLKEGGIALKVQPGHLDGAAGLKPIGNFYFFQAILATLPAAFLGVWCMIIPYWPGPGGRYSDWFGPYLALLPIALIFEVLAFLAPLWSFHQEMKIQKSALLVEADGALPKSNWSSASQRQSKNASY